MVAAGTPKETVHKISADMAKVLQSPEVKARMAEVGLTPVGNTPEQFDAYIRSEIPRWAQVVKASGATAD